MILTNSSRKNVTFLDVDANFLNGKIITDLHIKATDRHQYEEDF